MPVSLFILPSISLNLTTHKLQFPCSRCFLVPVRDIYSSLSSKEEGKLLLLPPQPGFFGLQKFVLLERLGCFGKFC